VCRERHVYWNKIFFAFLFHVVKTGEEWKTGEWHNVVTTKHSQQTGG
jgi:hypothetical protein